MKYLKKFGFILTFCTIFIVGILGANPVDAASNAGDFSIQPILSTNQNPDVGGYFDLILQSNQKQTVQFKLTNSSDKKTTYNVKINPAITSDAGTIDYTQTKPRLDKTLPFDLRDYVKIAKTKWTVAAKSTITIPIQVTMPSLSFPGRVIGGIYVTKATNATDSTNQKGVAIKTKIGYNLAIVLQQNTDKVAPDLKLLSGKAAKVNGYTKIQLHFRNPKETIIPDLIFTTKVYRNGKLYIKNTSNKFLVAPNTNFHLNLDLDQDRIQPGSYKVDVVATSGPFYKWHFTNVFTVTKEKADAVNKNAIFKTKENNLWQIIAAIVIGILAIIIIIFLIIFLKRRKKNASEN